MIASKTGMFVVWLVFRGDTSVPKSNTKRARRGVVIVEMALILPLFFMVVLGIIEFGRAMSSSQLITSAARLGARLCIIEDSTNVLVERRIRDFCETALGISRDSVAVAITIVPGANNKDPGNDVSKAKQGDLCSVTVTVPFDVLSYIRPDFISDKSLLGRCRMQR